MVWLFVKPQGLAFLPDPLIDQFGGLEGVGFDAEAGSQEIIETFEGQVGDQFGAGDIGGMAEVGVAARSGRSGSGHANYLKSIELHAKSKCF